MTQVGHLVLAITPLTKDSPSNNPMREYLEFNPQTLDSFILYRGRIDTDKMQYEEIAPNTVPAIVENKPKTLLPRTSLTPAGRIKKQ